MHAVLRSSTRLRANSIIEHMDCKFDALPPPLTWHWRRLSTLVFAFTRSSRSDVLMVFDIHEHSYPLPKLWIKVICCCCMKIGELNFACSLKSICMYSIMDLREHIVQKLLFMKFCRLALPLLYNMLLFLLPVLAYVTWVR